MITNKSKLLLLFLFTLIFAAGLQAQNIYFKYNDGTSASYNLKDVHKITFDADVMNLHLWNGSIYAWNVSTIGHYRYNELLLNVQEWLNHANAWELMVFPNPTSTTLNVCFSLSKEEAITIGLYDMEGKLIMEKNLGKKFPFEHKETLDISSVPEGTYMCRISGQHQSVSKKIIKK